MKFSSYTLGGLALALIFTLAPEVHADPIPWSYNWSRSPSEIFPDGRGPGYSGYITLTDERQNTAVGNSDIVATNLKTYSTASASNPDVYTAKPYSLTLTLTDIASGQSGSMTFTGVVSGKVSSVNANLQNTFTGLTTQQVVLGDNVYTTTIGPYTPPGPPTASNVGTISAHASLSVKVTSVETLPEPGTLALSFVGVTLLGAGRRWLPGRNRRAVK